MGATGLFCNTRVLSLPGGIKSLEPKCHTEWSQSWGTSLVQGEPKSKQRPLYGVPNSGHQVWEDPWAGRRAVHPSRMRARRSIFAQVSPGQDSALIKFPSRQEKMTPLPSALANKATPARPTSTACKPGPALPWGRALLAAPLSVGTSAAGRLLDSYWQGLTTQGRDGGGEEAEKPILFPGEKRLLLTAVRTKAKARAHVI